MTDVGDQISSTRRAFFSRSGAAVGGLALSRLLSRDLPAMPKPSRQHVPKAKFVIYMHMVGAPSTIDLFDPKPELVKRTGKLVPESLIEGKKFAFIRGRPRLLGSKFEYNQHGQSGIAISDRLPHLSKLADEIAVVRSMHTEQFNHAPAQMFMMTGFGQFGRPSFGSWVDYGLGSENEDLPAFVVLNSGTNIAGAGSALWGNGFLPSIHQGIEFRSEGEPVLFLKNPNGFSHEARGRFVEDLNDLNRVRLADVGDPEIATRISQYELAYRMQRAVPGLMDLSEEPAKVLEMYGAKPGEGSFASHCLLARRLVERGVRFVQLFNSDWDHHDNVFDGMTNKCRQVDQPMAALIRDLKQRGLLDQTLVVWGGEFGRTPMMQGANGDGADFKKAGRDHHKEAFAMWMAGGGIRPGTTYGATDDLGYHITEDPMHVNDLHATLLHLLGIDHEELTFKYLGRQFRLTDVGGKVARKLMV
jgi:hypothetical protein